MKALLRIGDNYAKKSSWRDFAVVKFCLFSMGLIAGMSVPDKEKKPVRAAAAMVFAVTYIPLMYKLFKVVRE